MTRVWGRRKAHAGFWWGTIKEKFCSNNWDLNAGTYWDKR